MATVVVLADPPREGLVLPEVPGTSALSAADAADLYAGALLDAVASAEDSGGDLLVNYLPEELLPEEHRRGDDVEAELREFAEPALSEPEAARFEPQVGSTRSARVGNTVTHLLREEDAGTVLVVDPRAPTLGRAAVDQLAMKLRRYDAVLAPSTRGRIAAAGFSDTLDFEDALAPPALETLTRRARDADLEVGFGQVQPVLETGGDVASVVSLVRARADAGRNHPAYTAAAVEELDVQVATGEDVTVRRGTDSS